MIILGVKNEKSLDGKQRIKDYINLIKEIGSAEEVLVAKMHNWEPAQLYEITEGVKSGIDISIYAKPYYNEYKMGLIRLAIEQNLNYKALLDPNLDEFVLRELYSIIEQQDS